MHIVLITLKFNDIVLYNYMNIWNNVFIYTHQWFYNKLKNTLQGRKTYSRFHTHHDGTSQTFIHSYSYMQYPQTTTSMQELAGNSEKNVSFR